MRLTILKSRCCVFLVEWWVDHVTISAKTNDIWLLPY